MYLLCCGKYLEQGEWAKTPGELMRSRFSAFVMGKLDYIERTQRGPAAKAYRAKNEKDGASVQWRELTVLQETDKTVTFAASYDLNGALQTYQETSLFRNIDGKWYYFKSM
jgi:SEC-C motif-containing protein